MSFPIMNKRSRQGVSIPDLAGGINLRDSLTTVQDNQLTDAVNMWFRDGALRTRPGVEKTAENIRNANIDMRKHDIFIDGKQLVSYLNWDFMPGGEINANVHFFLVGANESVEMKILELYLTVVPENYLVFKMNKWLYCLMADSIYALDTSEPDALWQYNVEPYVPLVMTNVLSTTQEESGWDISNAVTGDMVNGFNLLTRRYKAQYSTVNRSLLSSTQSNHKMIYQLPFGCFDCEGVTFTATITRDLDGIIDETTHTATFENMAYGEEKEVGSDNLRMKIYPKKIVFYKGDSVATVSEADYRLNNMVITAQADYDTNSSISKETILKNKAKVFGMTECTWFGGASAGINGGTRLFLCGNTKEGEENLVLWSGLNEPLYFSENCYAYVGDKDSRVTAFGKQSDMLVIFKENETYFTRYTRNDSITAEQLIDQSVIDLAASSVYFPLTLIHSHIGCDCSDTVQLCRNRLVWTNSNGKVYTLVTNNQYSERNIYEVGEMVERRLSNETNLKKAFSADWEGYYVLFCGANMYLMDYNSSGYQYVYSYQKNEDANVRIPWYYWKSDEIQERVANIPLLNINGTLAAVGENVYCFKDGGSDNGTPIHSSLTTKLFDFGAAGYRKNVDTVQLMLGNNGGAPISVGFVTDCGTEYDEITLDGDDRDSYSAGHISALTLSPCIRSVLRFGVKLESDGPLIVDGMTLGYRILGGAR